MIQNHQISYPKADAKSRSTNSQKIVIQNDRASCPEVDAKSRSTNARFRHSSNALSRRSRSGLVAIDRRIEKIYVSGHGNFKNVEKETHNNNGPDLGGRLNLDLASTAVKILDVYVTVRTPSITTIIIIKKQ